MENAATRVIRLHSILSAVRRLLLRSGILTHLSGQINALSIRERKSRH